MSIKLGAKPADVGLWQDIGSVGYAYSGPVKLLAVFCRFCPASLAAKVVEEIDIT